MTLTNLFLFLLVILAALGFIFLSMFFSTNY